MWALSICLSLCALTFLDGHVRGLLPCRGSEGFEVEGEKEYVLKLKKNLFVQRQAGKVWNKHLIEKLKQAGFVASQIDE
jgi:hypothetical protein